MRRYATRVISASGRSGVPSSYSDRFKLDLKRLTQINALVDDKESRLRTCFSTEFVIYGKKAVYPPVFRKQVVHSTVSMPEFGVRYYHGGGGSGRGGRGGGGMFQDFDRDYGQPRQERWDARDDFDSKDDFDDGLPRSYSDLRRMNFEEREEDKPKSAEERLAYVRAREREIMLKKFQSLVIDVNRTFKVTKGGGEISFTALVVCGNGDGLAGWAKGKGPKASRAISEASAKALENLHYFERFKGKSIYHYVEAKYEKTKVRLWPEWTLGKFRAAGIVRSILLLAGITNVKSKLIGSSNPHNTVKATFLALSKIKTPKEYEEQYCRAVVERHLILDADGNPHPKHRKVSSYVL